MARTKEKHFSIARVVSDKDFGSVRVESGEVIELSEGEDVEAAVNAMRGRVYEDFITELGSVSKALLGRDVTK